MTICQICGRELGTENIDMHHLMPKTFKGKSDATNLIPLHKICHRKLHSVISEKEMEKYYHTIEKLLEHSDIQAFVKWVAKKPIDYYSGSDETKGRRDKRFR
jgi:hypothetical protein